MKQKEQIDIYVENGYADRKEYLECLSDEYSVDIDIVKNLADLLGPEEDFDGLVTSLADYYGRI